MVGALHGVASWTEALNGRGRLVDALKTWVEILRASEALILRLSLDTAVEETVARLDDGQRRVSTCPSDISFPQYLLGHGLGKARARSVWYMSEFDQKLCIDADSGARLRFGDDRTREIAVVVLDPSNRVSDLLELRFTRLLSAEEMKSLSMLAGILSQVWQRRRANVISDSIAAHQRRLDRSEECRTGGSVLDAANPAGLSKAEYRVCMLMTHGLSAKLISRRLQVSESTVRSHLRNIYAKTEASGQRELMYRLLSSDALGQKSLQAVAGPGRGRREIGNASTALAAAENCKGRGL